jgi:hypothetical protein
MFAVPVRQDPQTLAWQQRVEGSLRVIELALSQVLRQARRFSMTSETALAAVDRVAAAADLFVELAPEVAGTLRELAALAHAGASLDAIEQKANAAADKIEQAVASLRSVETEVDPTPDTPPVVEPPVTEPLPPPPTEPTQG